MAPRACCSPSPVPRTWASRRSSDAADVVANAVDPEANIIFGTVVDESLGDQVRITVIATGFSDSNVNRQDELFAAQQSQSKAAACR